MIKILSELSGVTSVLPFLAISSLFPSWDGEFTIEPAFCVVTDSETDGNKRELWLPDASSPLISSSQTDDIIKIELDTAQVAPAGLLPVLLACGVVFRGTHGDKVSFEHHEPEVLYNRIKDLDSAWVLMRRFRLNIDQRSEIERCTEILLNLAVQWNSVSSSIGNHGSTPALDDEATRLHQIAENVPALNIPGLVSVDLQPDYRGSALEVRLTDRGDTFMVCPMRLDWAMGRLALARPAPPKADPGRFGVRPTKVPNDMINVLAKADISGHELRISERLPPARYAKVKAFLEDLGAEWSTPKQAHVFEEDAQPVIDDIIGTGEVLTSRDYEFFETQPIWVDEVIKLCGIEPGGQVLEPNAGRGAMAMAAAEIVGRDKVICYELMPRNVAKLQLLGFNIDGPTDFLSVTPSEIADFVIMNPPFSGFRDAQHIMHAYKFLKPGGRMAAIASTQWRTHTTGPAQRFQAFVAAMGASVRPIPRGAFKAVGTDVETTLLVFQKPKQVAAPHQVKKTAAKPAAEQVSLF